MPSMGRTSCTTHRRHFAECCTRSPSDEKLGLGLSRLCFSEFSEFKVFREFGMLKNIGVMTRSLDSLNSLNSLFDH